MNQVRTVRLYGVLGARFGRVFRLAVSSPAEAIRALCSQLPGLEQYLATSKQRGLTYAVFQGRRNVGEDELRLAGGAADIRIAPVVIGSKKGGVFQTILGAVLVVVGAYFGQPWLVAMGAGMVAGGVAQMLAPQAKGLSGREDPANAPSYAFGGPVNTTAMGNPVGVLYGKRRIGGAIISGGIYAEDQL
ncbi:tail assembly protein [Stutzerimonas stutzeri]|uniref:tail assembly protein n=1 Tax=Stutzerimonas stutzeri TaxID=316 RepID=UPI00210E535F|nr:tail assembly protein [Stutzerimonas stutzeri]MCQ4257486.1 tail assembly protein [Stutzerimonas stutzeri]